MPWVALTPVPKTTGRPMVSASVAVLKDGSARLNVFMSGMLHDEMGNGEQVDVLMGEGDKSSHLMLIFSPEGSFTLGKFVHSGRRVTAPAFAGMPTRATTAQPCKIVEKTSTGIVIALPAEAWAAELAERDRKPAALRPQPAPPQPAHSGDMVDMVMYFTSKGHTVHRLAGERLSIDGEVHPKPKALDRLNHLRSKADLPPLTLAEVS